MSKLPKTPGKHRRPKKRPKGRDAGSKMFVRRVKDARAFVSSVEVHQQGVAEGLRERLAPMLRAEGEAVPDHGMTLELVGRSVQTALEELRRAHRRYVEQTALCNRLSRDCDRSAKQEVYPRAVDLRRLLEGTFGKRESQRLHAFRGRIPTWRDGLRQQVGYTLDRLETPDLQLPTPKIPGAAIDRQGWLLQIRQAYDQLVEQLEGLATQELQREALGDGRRAAMQAFDDTLSESRALAEALFTLAGYPKRFGRNLRAYYERRWLSRWARQRREARRQAAGTTADGDRPRQGGLVANVSTWLASRFKSA